MKAQQESKISAINAAVPSGLFSSNANNYEEQLLKMEAEQQGRDLLNVMRRGTNFGGGAKKSMIGKHKSTAFKAMQSQAFTNNS